MHQAMEMAALLAMMLNVVHWVFTLRNGLFPEPMGLPGAVLRAWLFATTSMFLAAYLHWLSRDVVALFLFTWCLAENLCAFGIRHFRLPHRTPGLTVLLSPGLLAGADATGDPAASPPTHR